MKHDNWASKTISRPLALLGAVVMMLLLALTLFLVQQFDDATEVREEQLVEEGVRSRLEELSAAVWPVVVWDETVRNLDHRVDKDWALDNLGVYLSDTGGFEGVFAVDRDDRTIFASVGGRKASQTSFSSFDVHFRKLIANVRYAESQRGRLRAGRPAGEFFAERIQSIGVAKIHGRSYFMVVTLVGPDFGRYRPLAGRAPIVVATFPIDRVFLATIAERFQLESATMHAGQPTRRAGFAQAQLRDVNGRTLATITWLPPQPGLALLKRLWLPLALIGTILLVALLLAYRRSRNMAQGLVTSEKRATHMALHDSLTGLPNRMLFLERLRHGLMQMERQGGSVVVHCIDLDRLKNVNDTLGDLVGDELLRRGAARMAAQCRASDTIARLSGDEFAIVQINASESEAAYLAARICAIMAQPFELGSRKVFSGCSIGITRTEQATVDPIEMLRQADLALYRAKADGRGRFYLFDSAMDTAMKSTRAIESDLREALEADQLTLAYQPQVDGRGIISGVEALVRWTHPVRGVVSPGLFIPIAEQSGLIRALGMFTFRRAFEDSRRWPGLRISVNISTHQLRSNSFIDELRLLVDEMGIDPRRFELEITEGVLQGDDPSALEKLLALRRMGFALVLDDFGTGLSSLSYLRKYPIEKIKIDRTVIVNVGVDAESEELVLAIVRLARALNLGVIAEGVENLAQWGWLRSVGCPDSQGFFFSRAVAGDELDLLWRTPDTGLWSHVDQGEAHNTAASAGRRSTLPIRTLAAASGYISLPAQAC